MDMDWLADRLEIEATLIRYATALDTDRMELFDDVFTQDALVDYTASGGIRGSYIELRRWLLKAMSKFDAWQHLLSNMVIEIDGDRADAMTDCYNPLAIGDTPGDQRLLHVGARYHDRLLRTPVGWRIVERRLEVIWMEDRT